MNYFLRSNDFFLIELIKTFFRFISPPFLYIMQTNALIEIEKLPKDIRAKFRQASSMYYKFHIQ